MFIYNIVGEKLILKVAIIMSNVNQLEAVLNKFCTDQTYSSTILNSTN